MKILFQGDSITDAARTTLGGESLGCGYPLFVAGKILAEYPQKNFTVINRGISGNRVVDLYQRWKVHGLNLEPDVISILIGINETWHEFNNNNGVELDRYEMIYRELLKWTLKVRPDVRLILCEPFMFSDSQAGEGYKAGENWAAADAWREDVDARRIIVRKLAKEFDTAFVPFQEVLDDALKSAPPAYWLRDGVHPTTAGHVLMAEAWLKAAAPILGI